MFRRLRTPLAYIAVGLTMLATFGVVVILVLGPDRDATTALLQSVLTVLTPAGTLVAWLWARRQTRTARPRDHAEELASALAEQVGDQWQREAASRRLIRPRPIDVGWRWTDLPVTGPPTDAIRTGDAMCFPPLPGLATVTFDDVLTGNLADLHRLYGGLDSGRMILLGEAGAGKTATAILLLLDALAHRRSRTPEERATIPVPVLLTMRSWDPAHQPFNTWLAARLATDYPVLHVPDAEVAGPELLMRRGLIAVFLDGLDELPGGVRSAALTALDEQVTARLVIVCRNQELVAASSERHLSGAAAFELMRVNPADAADYLERSQVSPMPNRSRKTSRARKLRSASPKIPTTTATPM